MSSRKTEGGFDVKVRGNVPRGAAERREKLSERIADVVGPIANEAKDCDVVVIVADFTGTSILGHKNVKWNVIEKALENHRGLLRRGR